MSSRRLILSGLLSSRAHLRFAGIIILSTPRTSNSPALVQAHGLSATQLLASSALLLAPLTRIRGYDLSLRNARSLSQ
jgi:hypothetical protein